MPQVESVKDYNTFVKGIITEANALTYPENASIDEENFILKRDGSRERRLGMDYEADYTLGANITNVTFEDLAVSVHEWKNAGNSGLYAFSVVQIGTFLYFYDLTAASLSDNLKAFTVNLVDYKTPAASNIGSKPVSISTGKGVMYVVSPDTEPFYVEYNIAGDSITETPITIQQRDLVGFPTDLATEERPASLTDSHEYNLLNQGWTSAHITTYQTAKSVYPSDADIWILAKDSNDDFDASLLDKQFFGNTPAPKGHFILDTFSKERSGVSGVGTIGIFDEVEDGRPNSVAFYAGRVFYAGIESSSSSPTNEIKNSNIYFSQILDDVSKSGYCYQEADPTSEEISDLLGSDGGIVPIPEIGKVIKLVTVYDALVIFAENGVWQLKGDSDAGFTATGYQVQKITSIGAVGTDSVTVLENKVIYWADSGIYALAPDNISGLLSATSLTETTIQTLYNAIPSVSRVYAQGSYDAASKSISWLYNDSSTYDGATSRYNFTKELVFDTVLGSFYKHSISSLASLSPYVAGVITTPNLLTADVAYNVVVNGVQVQASAVDVQASLPTPARGTLSTKYLIVKPQDATNSKVTWGAYNNTNFLDWETADGTGIDFTSFLQTGYELFGDVSRDKSTPYIVTHFGRTETGFITNGSGGIDAENPSGCLLQARWDWADNASSGRWSSSVQAYRLSRLYIPISAADPYDYGFSVISTKNKIRGKGRSLGLYFTSETGKDMHLLGWSTKVLGQSSI